MYIIAGEDGPDRCFFTHYLGYPTPHQITSEHFKDAFSTGSILKHYKHYTIREEDLQAKDDSLPMNNYCVFRTDNKAPGVTEYVSYYFVEYPDKSLTGVTFACVNKTDRPFERHFVRLVYDTMISKTLFTPTPTRTVNFPGHEFRFGNSCRWMGGQPTTAKKVTYDFTGVRSVLVGIGGGKTLTVYYVAAMVGNDAVSCVMSFWNNDHLGPDGLPGLLEEVMTPKRDGQ